MARRPYNEKGEHSRVGVDPYSSGRRSSSVCVVIGGQGMAILWVSTTGSLTLQLRGSPNEDRPMRAEVGERVA